MKLRSKNLLITSLALFIFVVVVYFFTHRVFTENIVKNEKHEVEEVTSAAKYAVEDYIKQISYTASDWSAWDDLYAYVQGKNPEFEESNFNDSSIGRLRFNFVLASDASGKVIFQTAFDYKKYHRSEAPKAWIEILKTNGLLSHSSIAERKFGIVSLPEGAMFFASNPILTSEAEGPIAGTLFFGRFFDEEEADNLSKIMRRPFFAQRYETDNLPQDFSAAKSALAGGQDIFFLVAAENKISGYSYLKDVNGHPVLIIRADRERGIYQQSKRDLGYALIVMIILMVIYSAMIFSLVDLFITKRIGVLIAGAEDVARSGDASRRIAIKGGDEVAMLGARINKMLESISNYQKETLEYNKQLQKRVKELEDFKRFAVDREIRMMELKKEISKIKKTKNYK
jgi:sensor domain CHASE-containing protein